MSIDKAAQMLEDFLLEENRPLTKVKKLFPQVVASDETPKVARAKATTNGLSNSKAAAPAGPVTEYDLEDKDAAFEAIGRKMQAMRTK